MSTRKFEKIRRHWVWPILVFLVPTTIALIALLQQCRTTRHEFGGFLNATFHSRVLNNKDQRTFIVCVDDTTQLNQRIYITPTFDNPDEFSLRDFSLTFEVIAHGLTLLPSDKVSIYEEGNKTVIYQYKDDVLHAHRETKNPFSGFKMSGDVARCEIISKVSFDGAVSLFEYRTDVWFIYQPNTKNLSFDYWKSNCKQKIFELIEDQKFDVYYLSKNEKPEYQFDVLLSSNNTNNKSSKNINENKDSKESNIIDNETNKNLVTIADYNEEDAKANSSFDIIDYIILSEDTIKCEIFFNHPVKKTGTYVLKYDVKDGWKLKSCYTTVFLKEGNKGCSLILNNNIKKIANLEIYHQVNPKKILDIRKNYNGYLSFILKNTNALVGLNYEDGGYYFRNGGINAHFDKAVTIEIFNKKQSWWEKLFKDEDGLDDYTYLYIFLSLVAVFLVLAYISEKSEKIDNLFMFTTLGGFGIIMLFFGIFLLIFLYNSIIYLYNYIYLTI